MLSKNFLTGILHIYMGCGFLATILLICFNFATPTLLEQMMKVEDILLLVGPGSIYFAFGRFAFAEVATRAEAIIGLLFFILTLALPIAFLVAYILFIKKKPAMMCWMTVVDTAVVILSLLIAIISSDSYGVNGHIPFVIIKMLFAGLVMCLYEVSKRRCRTKGSPDALRNTEDSSSSS